MPVYFHGQPMLAEKFDFPGDSGHYRRGSWHFEPLPQDFKMPYIGWWISEKYDGVRAIWNGEKLLSRSGQVFHAPSWWLDKLPRSVGLDGELYCGLGSFQQVSGTVRRKTPREQEWKHVEFRVFDILHPTCLEKPFKCRYKWLEKIVQHGRKKGAEHLHLVKQYPITSMKQVYDLYKSWLRKGGEGAVIRDPKAPYIQKRTSTLLKWKPILDKDAKVVGFVEGKGQFKGMLGAFKVQMISDESGKLTDKYFNLAGRISKDFRSQYKFKNGHMTQGPRRGTGHPMLGDIVSYEYMSMTQDGYPRQPIFIRVRNTNV